MQGLSRDGRHVLGAVACCLISAAAGAQAAKDYRADFPTQYSESQMGVNLQTGTFRYQPYSFDMGPFQQRRGFGQAPFQFSGSVAWDSKGPGGVYEAKVKLNDVTLVFILASAPPTIVLTPWTAQSMGWNLERTTAGYTLTDRSGNTYQFSDGVFPDTYTSSALEKAEPVPTGTTGPAANAGLTRIAYADGSTVDISSSGQKTLFRSNRGYAMLSETTGSTSAVCGFNLTITYADLSSSCASSSYKVTSTNQLDQFGSYRPVSLVDVASHTSTIQYLSSGHVQCVTLPNSSTCEFTNSLGIQPGDNPAITFTRGNQVRKQVDAMGRVYTYNYEPPDQNTVDNPPTPGFPTWSTAYMNDPAGRLTWLRFDRGVLVNQQTPEDILTFSYPSKVMNLTLGTTPVTIDYHGQSPAYVRHQEGNLDYYAYNKRGSVMIASKFPKGAPEPTSSINGSYIFSTNPDLHDCCVSPDVPNIPTGSSTIYQSFKADYPPSTYYATGCGNGPADAKLCDKPILVIDPKGNQYDYTYDAVHGGVLTKTPPPDANGIRAQVRFEYAQRYAWVKAAGGGYTTAGDPIWVKTRERSCKTSATITTNGVASCQGGASDEVVTDYEYGPNSGPNNLLLRGVAVTANGQTLRTCYGYDANGRKVSETKPAAGLGVCP